MGANVKTAVIISICLAATPAIAQDTALAANDGYLLVRVFGVSHEKRVYFDFTNEQTGDVFKLADAECESTGASSKMCLLAMPRGRYFWSRYESKTYFRMELSKIQEPVIQRDLPGSESDTFEIVPGVLNYVGDWRMHMSEGDFSGVTPDQHAAVTSRRWKIDIEQNMPSLAIVFDKFPSYTSGYQISLSMMGKEAMPLAEFIKIMQAND